MSVRRSVWVGCAVLMVGACGTTGGSVGDGGAPSTTLAGAPSGNANVAAVDATPHSPAPGKSGSPSYPPWAIIIGGFSPFSIAILATSWGTWPCPATYSMSLS